MKNSSIIMREGGLALRQGGAASVRIERDFFAPFDRVKAPEEDP